MPYMYMDWTQDDVGNWVWDPEQSPGELFHALLTITRDRKIVWSMNGTPVWEQKLPTYDAMPIEELQWHAIAAVQAWGHMTAWKAGEASMTLFLGERDWIAPSDRTRWFNFFGIDLVDVWGFQVSIHVASHLGALKEDGSFGTVLFREWRLYRGGDFPSGRTIISGKIPDNLTPIERRAYALKSSANYLSGAAERLVTESLQPEHGEEPPVQDYSQVGLFAPYPRLWQLPEDPPESELLELEPGRSRFDLLEDD